MDLGLGGQAALVTGAGRGIGAAIAWELAREGCDVALVDRDEATAQQAAETVRSSGRRALAIRSDVARPDAAGEAVETVRRTFGRLDILICCAGIARDAVVWKMSQEVWDEVIAVNLTGCFAYCRAAAPGFREQRSGCIVTLASINALRGKAGQANYAASKAGVIALTKTLARELGPSGVTVNCVAPGMIRTPLIEHLPPRIRDQAVAESALGRIGEPEDVAAVVAFLCSPRARHLTGSVVTVDGGQYL